MRRAPSAPHMPRPRNRRSTSRRRPSRSMKPRLCVRSIRARTSTVFTHSTLRSSRSRTRPDSFRAPRSAFCVYSEKARSTSPARMPSCSAAARCSGFRSVSHAGSEGLSRLTNIGSPERRPRPRQSANGHATALRATAEKTDHRCDEGWAARRQPSSPPPRRRRLRSVALVPVRTLGGMGGKRCCFMGADFERSRDRNPSPTTVADASVSDRRVETRSIFWVKLLWDHRSWW